MRDGKPETLQEAIIYFADPDTTHKVAVELRWPDGETCPHCGSTANTYIKTRRIWRCKECEKQFSVKLGTIFEDSPIGLAKWFVAIWMLANCKNGISSYELARGIGVTQKTAWFMLHRIRAAMKARSFDRKLCGIVEADETFIGGKLRNMHKSKRAKARHGFMYSKAIVQGILERNGEVRARVLRNLQTLPRVQHIRENVEKGSRLMTDEGAAWMGVEYVHEFINHQEEYVRGNVHTQGIENFWSLLKRGLKGTYVSVEPFHLSRYVDEQCFRYNNRKTDDADRFVKALSQVAGRRLTWMQLVGEQVSEHNVQ
jgi:transposase-like protein